MKKAILIGAVVVGALVVLALFLPALLLETGTNTSVGVVFYDENGNKVGMPLGFIGSSGAVDNADFILSYVVTSSAERFEENLEVWGSLLIEWRVGTLEGGFTTAYDLPVSENRAATGSWLWNYNLRDIIVVDEMGKTYGWTVQVTGTLTARTTMVEGEVVTSALSTDIKTFTLAWESDSLVINTYVGV